ncbi:hypothetical protein J3Q64DRAFT_1853553 [Phycomyces blakesleeanus]|uniref:PROP1-like PPR domain-containing protein n=1 Tax=Phycomyces blakesleeanus TaxID=4837 RepID=A0ABR3AJ24_PHYBL
MLSSAVAGTCQQCKKGRTIKPKNPVDALINLHLQSFWDNSNKHSNTTNLGRTRITTNPKRRQVNLAQCQLYSQTTSVRSLRKTTVTVTKSTPRTNYLPVWNPINLHFNRAYVPFDPQNHKKSNHQTTHDAVLSAALGQSDASTAQSLIDIAFQMLSKKKPELAWECYSDISAKGMLGYLSSDQFKHLIKHFSSTAHRGNGLEYILTLMEDMQNMGYRVGRKEKMLVLRLLGTRGKIDEMEGIFQDVTKDDATKLNPPLPLPAPSSSSPSYPALSSIDSDILSKPYNIVLAAYEEHNKALGKFETAKRSMDVYGQMIDRGLRPSEASTLILTANIRRGADDPEVVEHTWTWLWNRIGKEIGQSNTELVDPLLYRNMVMFFASVGRPDWALEINDIMRKKKIPRDVRMMTALIHKVGRSGDLEQAMGLLDEMKRINLVPNTVTLNALIDIHVHKLPQPDLAGAIRSYSMFAEQGLQPNEITFGTLIDMFGKKGDIDRVRELYQDMVHTHKIKPTQHIFSSLIECFITKKDFISALSVVKLMRKPPVRVQPNDVNFNLLISSFADDNDIYSAVLFLKTLIKAGIKPTAQSYHPILTYYSRRGDVESVKSLLQKMHGSNIKLEPITYGIFLDAYSKAGDVNGAEKLFKEYKSRWRPNAYIFNSMMYVYILQNDLDRVLDIYKEMMKTNVKMTEHSYGLLMYCYSLRKEPDATEALMETMKTNNVKPSLICWNILLGTYFKVNRPTEGREVVDRMAKEGIVANYPILSTFIDGLTKTGNVEVAESVLQSCLTRFQERLKAQAEVQAQAQTVAHRDLSLLTDALPNSDQSYVTILPQTIEDLLKANNTKDVFIDRPPPHMFVPLLQHYVKTKEISQAKSLFVQMRDLGVESNPVVYVTMMKLYLETDDFDRVEMMWNAIRSPSPEQKQVDTMDPELGQIPLPQPSSKRYPVTLLPFYDYAAETTKKNSANRNNSTNAYDTIDELFKDIVEPKRESRFALAVYLDALLLQNRFKDIDDLWKDLSSSHYIFDEHNWNQYVATMVKGGRLLEACRAVKDKLIEADGSDVKSSSRKGEFSEDRGNSISTKTCWLLVDALEIPGADGMGREILRKTVVEQVRSFLRKHTN